MVFKIYVELFETISRSIKFNYLNEIITINITSLALYIKGCGQLSCADASKFTGYVKVYQTIFSVQHARLLKQALKSDTKIIYRRYRKLESNVFTNGLGPDVFKFTLKGHCLGKSIKFTFPVNSVLRPLTTDQGPVCPKSP